MQSLRRKIAFSMAHGLVYESAAELLDRIGGVDAYFDLSERELTGLSGLRNEIFDDSYRRSLLDAAAREQEFLERHHARACFFADDDYPQRLKACTDAPLMLYGLGSTDLDSAHMVSVVGTRHSTAYGIDMADRLVRDLARDLDSLVIVSGLAYGIDVTAHKAAIAAGVPTVGVVAHGLNMIYPADHREVAAKMARSGGAILTEYRSDSAVHRSNFLARNRIVAGMCDVTVVVESDLRGGAMSTARTARNYDREVMAYPGRATDRYSRGTNKLILNQTASIITCADDLIQLMGWTPRAKTPEQPPTLFRSFSPDQQRVLDCLTAHPEITVNELCVLLGVPYSHITDDLFQLEMADAVRALPGGRYAVADYRL